MFNEEFVISKPPNYDKFLNEIENELEFCTTLNLTEMISKQYQKLIEFHNDDYPYVDYITDSYNKLTTVSGKDEFIKKYFDILFKISYKRNLIIDIASLISKFIAFGC